MQSLRSQIKAHETQHGRSLSLRRAYNELLTELLTGGGEEYTLNRTQKAHRCAIFSVCASEDGSKLFTASEDGTIKIWDPDTLGLMQTLGAELSRACQGRTRHVENSGCSHY